MSKAGASNTRILDAALACAKLGWRVHPLKPSGKVPLLKSWPTKATTDERAIHQWWGKWLGANIGIATGAASNLLVIDSDDYRPRDKTLDDLEAEYGALPDTAMCLTGGGGRQFFFVYPHGVDIRNSSSLDGSNVDVRGNGGYVAAAPSIHPDTGKAYVWDVEHDPLDGQVIAELPPAWVKRLASDRVETRAPITDGELPARVEALLKFSHTLLARRWFGDTSDPELRDSSKSGLAMSIVTELIRQYVPEADVKTALRIWCAENGAADKGDRDDWVERTIHKAFELNAKRQAKREDAEPLKPRILSYEPFPVDALPEPIRTFVAAAARAIGCAAAYVILPLLSALASAIGNSRRIRLKRGWEEVAVLWTVIIGESGTLKTPAFRLALRPVRARQTEAFKRHAEAVARYEKESVEYEKNLATWKRAKKSDDEPPIKPEYPVAERVLVSDCTIEALAPILLGNWRGVLLMRDELAGWVLSFDRYVSSKGGAGDLQNWMQMHGAEAITIDRKTGPMRTIHVPSAAVCVTGGVQPGVLERAIGPEMREAGLSARLLFANPPRKRKRWSEAEIPRQVEKAVETLFDRLYELQPDFDREGDPLPRIVLLTPEAKRVWVAFVEDHAAEHVELKGDLSAAWSKLEGGAARLALVVHLVRAATDPAVNGDAVDEVSITAGITLSKWFGHEVRRLYGSRTESKGDEMARELLEWIQSQGGSVSVRDVTRGLRRYRGSAELAEGGLGWLVEQGYGRWIESISTPAGGRPTKRFEAVFRPDGDETSTDDAQDGVLSPSPVQTILKRDFSDGCPEEDENQDASQLHTDAHADRDSEEAEERIAIMELEREEARQAAG